MSQAKSRSNAQNAMTQEERDQSRVNSSRQCQQRRSNVQNTMTQEECDHSLVNSSRQRISFEEGKIISIMPETIFVEFPECCSNQQFFNLETHPKRCNWIPINPVKSELFLESPDYRMQFPIRLSCAMTIHKSQGQTLSKVVINLGNSERQLRLSFVSLSRVKKIQNLLLEPFAIDRLSVKIRSSKNLASRLSEETRLCQMASETCCRHSDCF